MEVGLPGHGTPAGPWALDGQSVPRHRLSLPCSGEIPYLAVTAPPTVILPTRGREVLRTIVVGPGSGPRQASAELDIVPAGLPGRAHALGSLEDGGQGGTSADGSATTPGLCALRGPSGYEPVTPRKPGDAGFLAGRVVLGKPQLLPGDKK